MIKTIMIKQIGKNKRYLNKINTTTKNLIEERKKIVLKQILIENNIKEKLRTEKTINIVLDNYTASCIPY
jgi:hypothetical protein